MADRKGLITRWFVPLMIICSTMGLAQLCENCLSACDSKSGVCSGNCALSWDGPTCSRRNVALNQRTKQSSDYSYKGVSFVSSLAVDGRTGHQFFNKPYTCAHTMMDPQPAHWTVTLDAQYNIYRFRIYNRNERCEEQPCGARLNGFTLSVGNTSQNYKLCYEDTTTSTSGPGAIINGVCNGGPVHGDIVRIMPDTGLPLTLCEVQIFVCIPGTYGEECGNSCGHCAEGRSVCNTISGNCPWRTPRCMPGYSGLKCDTVCTPGIYGADCLKRCGHCADNQSACDATSGNCTDVTPRCMPGYSGPRCDTACNGTYGPDCGQTCGHCAGLPTVCDVKNGNCTETTPRCMPGYSGVRCDTVCKRGTYGPDCGENCGFCAEGNIVCNSTSGHCPDREPRCAPGYTGVKCFTDNSPDYTFVIAGSAGGVSVVLIIGVIILVVMIRRMARTSAVGRIPEPTKLRDACNGNSHEEPTYEVMRQNVAFET